MSLSRSHDSSNSSHLLHKLCTHICGLPPNSVFSQFQLALSILAGADSTSSEKDEFKVSEKMKKALQKDNRHEDVVRFSDLYRKLQSLSTVKNRAAILSFLLGLKDSSKNVMTASLTSPIDIDLPSMVSSLSSSAGSSTKSCQIARVAAVRSNEKGSELLPLRNTSAANGSAACVSEKETVREVLFSFQGISGKMVKLNELTEQFYIDSKVSLSAPHRCLILRLAELGYYYTKINKFCENQTGDKSIGVMTQSFVSALQQELAEYYRLLAVLESQLHLDAEDAHLSEKTCNLTLRRLQVWALDPSVRLRCLAALVEDCKSLKGGSLASVIHNHMFHGDPDIHRLVKQVLTAVVLPWYRMLCRWIHSGELEDPYNEFFIGVNLPVQLDSLWHDKYFLRKNMVPSFLSESQARKILSAGKAINFLRYVCHDQTAAQVQEVVMDALDATSVQSLFTKDEDGAFHTLLETTYKETNCHVLSVLNNQYKFKDHLHALRQYLLLGQGDFIRHLMDVIDPHLSKPAQSLYQHSLTEMLECAVRATNAQFADNDILKRLDVRFLEINPGDTGWDVFSLDYHVDGPIGTVFTPYTMSVYLRLFNHLWRSKRIEYVAANAWRDQMTLFRMLRGIPEISPVLHQCHVLLSEMVHFVQQMQYYTAFEVMECSWAELQNKVDAADDLDQLIKAHEEFLAAILTRALLDVESRDILSKLRAIFDLILQFKETQDQLLVKAIEEVQSQTVYGSLKSIHTIDSSESELTETAKTTPFIREMVPKIQASLRLIANSYQNLVQNFLVSLMNHRDQNLQFLSFRLDFNEYYKNQNMQLHTSYTFQHRRKSMMTPVIL